MPQIYTRRWLVRTKLVATLGPATDDPQRLSELLTAGVDVCRLNFSHGTHEEHARRLAMIRDWSAENGLPVAVLGDLCGPKIRVNEVVGGCVQLSHGDRVRLRVSSAPATAEVLTTEFVELVDQVAPGHRVFIDDGMVRLRVDERAGDELLCTCLVGGDVASRKGINLPDTPLTTPALTDKDRADLAWAVAHGLDFVGLSFVQRPDDLRELRELIRSHDGDQHIVAKIERPAALDHLEELVALSDAVMVARGDLGVEVDVWRTPLIQKRLIRMCQRAGKPVIVATQMLQSMIDSPMPTRAEVSDVANAIFDATDAVMLSAETAVGRFALDAVEMMGQIAETTEEGLDESSSAEIPGEHGDVAGATVRAAVTAARTSGARAVASWANTGTTVRRIAQHRLPLPIVGLTQDQRVARRLTLCYGVLPLIVPPSDDPVDMAQELDARLLAHGLVQRGDRVVVVTSTRPFEAAANDTVLIHTVQ